MAPTHNSISRYEAEGRMGSDGHVYARGSLADLVHTALIEAGFLDAAAIRVLVGEGEDAGRVTLIGPVQSAVAGERARQIAVKVAGVLDVDNQLVVD